MGAAALVADGCNITQGLTNSATLSVGSLVAFVSMCAGAWLTLWALYCAKLSWRRRRRSGFAAAQRVDAAPDHVAGATRDGRVAGDDGEAVGCGHRAEDARALLAGEARAEPASVSVSVTRR